MGDNNNDNDNKPIVILTSQNPLDQHSSQKTVGLLGVFPVTGFSVYISTEATRSTAVEIPHSGIILRSHPSSINKTLVRLEK